jgi:hypothetical protein
MVKAATPATDFRTKGQLESGGHRVNRYHRMTFPDTSLPLTMCRMEHTARVWCGMFQRSFWGYQYGDL